MSVTLPNPHLCQTCNGQFGALVGPELKAGAHRVCTDYVTDYARRHLPAAIREEAARGGNAMGAMSRIERQAAEGFAEWWVTTINKPESVKHKSKEVRKAARGVVKLKKAAERERKAKEREEKRKAAAEQRKASKATGRGRRKA